MRGIGASFVVAVLVLVAAGCGGSSHSGGSTSSTVQLPSASSVPGGQPSSLDCGTLRKGAGPLELVAGRKDAPACFATAFAHCRPATLDYTNHGVDTGDEHVLLVQPAASGCRVTDQYRHYSPVRSLNKKNTFECATVQAIGGGIVVRGCGAIGDVAIPAVGTK